MLDTAGFDEGTRCSRRSQSGCEESRTAGWPRGSGPSTNELAAFYRINPATAAKGVNMLVDDGLLDKRRGIGMFVSPGARALLRAERRAVRRPLRRAAVAEARRLGLGPTS